jgi:hypothetical protein
MLITISPVLRENSAIISQSEILCGTERFAIYEIHE